MHICNVPSFLRTNRIGAPHGETLGLIKPLSKRSLSFSYVTLLVAVNFEIDPEQIPEPILVSTPIGESVIAKQVYKKFHVTILYWVICVDLIE